LTGVGDVERARLEELFRVRDVHDLDIRPMVRRRRPGASGWVLALCAFVAAVILFVILESRRSTLTEPSVQVPASVGRQDSADLPPLNIPPAAVPPAYPSPPTPAPLPLSPVPLPQHVTTQLQMDSGRLIPPPQQGRSDWPAPMPAYAPPPPRMMPDSNPPAGATGFAAGSNSAAPRNRTSAPILVIDIDASDPPPSANAGQPGGRTATVEASSGPAINANGSATQAAAPARQSNFANRSATVPQGTLIPAVLETAFDSTSPGFARAIVSRNVRGFDGSRVLIPRGSRLVGEYKSETSSGQRRVLINWTQLIRPDGLVMSLDSPAVDPLGRGGIPAKVTSNGVGRFLGSLLQSTFDLGRTILAQRVGGTLILAYPGAIPSVAEAVPQTARDQPRLRVDPGTSISVFVARDLVFANLDKTR
jgi:type IV secretion system protein VirB10